MSTMNGPPQQDRSPGAIFAKSLRFYRTDRGLGLRELAERLEELGHPIHFSALGKIETGHRKVLLDDVVAISIALDVPVAMLASPAVDALPVSMTPAFTVDAFTVWSWWTGSGRARVREVPGTLDLEPDPPPLIGQYQQAQLAFVLCVALRDMRERDVQTRQLLVSGELDEQQVTALSNALGPVVDDSDHEQRYMDALRSLRQRLHELDQVGTPWPDMDDDDVKRDLEQLEKGSQR